MHNPRQAFADAAIKDLQDLMQDVNSMSRGSPGTPVVPRHPIELIASVEHLQKYSEASRVRACEIYIEEGMQNGLWSHDVDAIQRTYAKNPEGTFAKALAVKGTTAEEFIAKAVEVRNEKEVVRLAAMRAQTPSSAPQPSSL